jgi:predicted RNase H-like nuclease (RuvC/YqgF family)
MAGAPAKSEGKLSDQLPDNARIRRLEAKLARFVPRIEHEALIAELQLRIADLEVRLSESKIETSGLKARVARLESRPEV